MTMCDDSDRKLSPLTPYGALFKASAISILRKHDIKCRSDLTAAVIWECALTVSPMRFPSCAALAADTADLVSHSVILPHLIALHMAACHLPQFPKALLQMTCKITIQRSPVNLVDILEFFLQWNANMMFKFFKKPKTITLTLVTYHTFPWLDAGLVTRLPSFWITTPSGANHLTGMVLGAFGLL